MSVIAKSFPRVASFIAASLLVLPASAVEVGSSANTNNPGTPSWNYVGSLNGASGVFLGNYGGYGWVLTAAHVGPGTFTLGNSTYTATGTSFTNFTDNSTTADLTLFQINGTPSLTNLSLVSLSTNDAVQLVGNGLPNGQRGESWGDNTVYGFTTYTLNGFTYGGPGVVTLASGGAQGVGGDSGGGLFFESGGTSYLAGILSGVGTIFDSNNVSLGDGTIAVDLPVYFTEINADLSSANAIPEPSAFAALGGLAVLVTAVVRRRIKNRA